MFQLVQRRRWYFLGSGIFVLLGFAIMIFSTVATDANAPFRFSIDFEGGTIYELDFENTITETEIRDIFRTFGEDNIIVQQVGASDDTEWSVRSGFLEADQNGQLLDALDEAAGLNRDNSQFDSVSPTIGSEVTRAALLAIGTASLMVVIFINYSFRRIPNSLRYGVCALVAMGHDVMVMLVTMSVAGVLLGWELDALFFTSVLTVVGFSVQDSIVVFDRIRENVPKYLGEPYETIVNRSLLETVQRSLATSINTFFIIIAILLFGGPTVKQFIAILFVGLVSGTYSSIFIAVPLLVAWEKGEIPFIQGRSAAPTRTARA